MGLFDRFKRKPKPCIVVTRHIKDNGDISTSQPINLLPGDTLDVTYTFTTSHEGATITAVKKFQVERIS